METRDAQIPHTSVQTRGMTTVGPTEDNQSAEISQICTLFQESRDNINEWLICIEHCVDETTKKLQIERVPDRMRRIGSNGHCYDPLVVSIGPYHHGKFELCAFEMLKIQVAQKFVRACGNQVSTKQLYEEVVKVGKSARECYEGGSSGRYDDERFDRMMFLDACFVLHFWSSLLEDEEQNEVDQQLNMSGYSVWRDFFLLENQIPFIVLKVLFEFRFEGKEIQTFFLKRVAEYFTVTPRHGNSWTNAVKNFLAQMTGCYSKSDREEKKPESLLDPRPPHLLHLVRKHLISPYMHDSRNKRPAVRRPESFSSVTKLKSAGIHFIPSQTRNLTDVKFISHLIFGTLTLPPILVDDTTKSLLLNLVAYENCPNGPNDSCISSYIDLMGSLIAGPDDVKELRKKRIIVNWSGSDEELAHLFKEIAQDLVPRPRAYAYADVVCQIQNHCQKKLPSWVQSWMDEEWMHKYFRSPWAFLAFLGAIIALFLTAVQTYFTVFPRKT